MPQSASHGLDGLLEHLSEQQLLRSTGAIAVGEDGCVYVVFGHALHAVAGGLTGLSAVDAIGGYARNNPDCTVTWTPGRTAARAHSLAPGDRVLERLRGLTAGAAAAARAEEERATDRIEDLGLRRRFADEHARGQGPNSGVDEAWGNLINAICALLEDALHRHARGLVDTLRRAEPDPRSILTAVDRARALPVRAVSQTQVASLLDAAEGMVRERLAAPWAPRE
jgi:hypothetical protein